METYRYQPIDYQEFQKRIAGNDSWYYKISRIARNPFLLPGLCLLLVVITYANPYIGIGLINIISGKKFTETNAQLPPKTEQAPPSTVPPPKPQTTGDASNLRLYAYGNKFIYLYQIKSRSQYRAIQEDERLEYILYFDWAPVASNTAASAPRLSIQEYYCAWLTSDEELLLYIMPMPEKQAEKIWITFADKQTVALELRDFKKDSNFLYRSSNYSTTSKIQNLEIQNPFDENANLQSVKINAIIAQRLQKILEGF